MILTPHTRIVLTGLLGSVLLFAAPLTTNAGLILQAPTYVGLGSGLVGWWTFDGDDMQGNTALDRVGGNQGSLLNGAARTIGNLGQAVAFDGANDMIDTATSNGLHNLSPMTISLWIRPRSFGESDPGAAFLSKGDQECFSDPSFDDGWTFGIAWRTGDPGQLCFQAGFASGNLNVESPQDTVTLNEWQHIALSWDGTAEADNVLFFRNAAAVAMSFKDDGAGARNDDSGETLMIGANDDTSLNYDGIIDEIRIYHRQLTPDEIKRLYKIGSTLKYGAPNSTGSLASGLLGWWTMDGSDTSRNGAGEIFVADRSGSGHNASSTETNPTPVHGKIGQGMNFDSVDNLLNLGHPASLENITAKTICAWIKPTSFERRDIMGKYDTGGNGGWIFRLGPNCATGQDLCYFNTFEGGGGNGYWSTSGGITLNDWNHACMTYDNSSDTNDPALYIDGVSKAVTQTLGPSGVPVSDAGTDLVIGNIMNAGDSSFGGIIDDVRLWSRILLPDEIKRLYKMGSTLKQGAPNSSGSLASGLVGWWTFDGADTSTNSSGILATADRSGTGNTAKSTSAAVTPVTTIGKIGQALTFDGANDLINTDAANSESLNNLAPITVSAWIKPRTLPTDTSVASNRWIVSTHSDGSFEWYVNASTQSLSAFSPTGLIKAGQWQHIVTVWDGTVSAANVRLYYNGSRVATTPLHDLEGVRTSETGLFVQIGEYDPFVIRFDGAIDDIRIYERMVTDDEVKRLYNMGR